MPEKAILTLRYRKDEDTWKECLLKEETIIGSGEGCDLVIADSEIAAQHIRVSIKPDGVWITDLSAKEGLKLEGKPLNAQTAQPFSPDQTFQIGSYTFTLFKLAAAPAAALPERAAAHNKTLAWVLDHALLVGGGFVLIALVILAAVFILGGGQQRQAAALFNQTATALALQVTQQAAKPVEPSKAPNQPPVATKTVQPFENAAAPTAAQSAAQVTVNAPGLGEIQINPINILNNGTTITNLWQTLLTISSGQTVNLNTNVNGSNIGFLYSYVGLKTKAPDGSDAFQTVAMNYIGAEKTKEVDGVQIPDWGTGNIPVKFDWKPSIYSVGDGKTWEKALVFSVNYSATSNKEDASLATNGKYTLVSGNEYSARIFFDAKGGMLKIIGYKGIEGYKGAPFEILPANGDKFTILLQRFEFDKSSTQATPVIPPAISNLIGQATALPFGQLIGPGGLPGYGKGKFVNFEGGTLTYQGESFTWKMEEKVPGDYVVGFIAEDLDTNYTTAYVPVKVK